MNQKSAKWLEDIRGSCRYIIERTASITFEEYEKNLDLRLAIERQLEIIGEAVNRLAKNDPEVVKGIRHYREII